MKILIVNTSEKTGGAAVAANRLMVALNACGEQVSMVVRRHRWAFFIERLTIFVHTFFRRDHLFEIDIANVGENITTTREYREADIIHLHWVNQGMISLKVLRKIVHSNKGVVWTMHDLWPATAICHYAGSCSRYKSHCHHCPLLPAGGHKHDLSARVWERKRRALADANIQFVACSRWLAGEARGSALLRGHEVSAIPNTIDTSVFHPLQGLKRRDKHTILFVSQKVTDERKGMTYFIEALKILVAEHPEMASTTAVAVLGGHSEEIASQLPLETRSLGYISDDKAIVEVYNSADVFVLPSMQDNLPNTIMEAMACGVPCVGFRVGGIPEMIDHHVTGYVATPADAVDLAAGIRYVLAEADYDALVKASLAKVATRYSQRAVAMRYVEVYNKALAYKRYKI